MYRKFIKSLSKADVNFALKCLWDKIEELEAVIASSASAPEVEVEFDWKTSTDKDALEVYGREIGFEVDKRKSAKNIIKSIEAHLNEGE